MATAPALISIEQYLRSSYSPDVDFVDGEIEERNLGEFDHGHIQGLLFSWFIARKVELRALPAVEQRIMVAPSRIRICDVAVVSSLRPREQVSKTPPVICIEVLSREDRISRAEEVLSDYLAMGVLNIWLIDPIRRSSYVFNEDGLHMTSDNILRVTGTEIALEMDTLFEALDETN